MNGVLIVTVTLMLRIKEMMDLQIFFMRIPLPIMHFSSFAVFLTEPFGSGGSEKGFDPDPFIVYIKFSLIQYGGESIGNQN